MCRWLAHVAHHVYEFLPFPGRACLDARAGLPYWSPSRYLKLKVKRAVSYVGAFEETLGARSEKRGADGVVCGHIHHAELRDRRHPSTANDGDWVESLTALAEHADGRLEILEWTEHLSRSASKPAPPAAVEIPETVEA